MKRISFNFFIIISFLLQSCIKDDAPVSCREELLLKFRYTINNQYTNLFDAEVNKVTIYIFDSNGKYVDTFTEQGDILTNDYVMSIPLPSGKYNALIYGGEMSAYSLGELNEQTNALNQTLRKGVTDINDFRAELTHIIGDDNYLHPVIQPDNLYVGLSTDAISAIDNKQVTVVDLIKITKKIVVKITGTDLIGAPLEVYITARNGRYNFENNIDSNYDIFKYMATNTSTQPNYMEADITMMRLMIGQSPMLVIRNSITQEILYNENMIEQILLTQQYISQEDFDREDEFIFEIAINGNIHSIKLVVTINGWSVNEVFPDAN